MARFLIDGELVESLSGESYEIRNPANTDEVVDVVPKGSREDVKLAIDSAEKGFEKWSSLSAHERASALLKIAEIIEKNRDELAVLLTREHGKTIRESRREIERAAYRMRYYAGLASQISGRFQCLEAKLNKYFITVKEPFGITAGILPWNVPVTKFTAYVAPALAAGNVAIVKPSSTAPLAVLKICELIQESKTLPEGVLNAVVGPGSSVGDELVKHKKIEKIVLTGSTDTGIGVLKAAANSLKHVTLELGGSDPMIVFEDADLNEAVKAAIYGRFRMTGQVCMAVKRLFIHEKIYEKFKNGLLEGVMKIRVGNGLKMETDMGPLHTFEQLLEVKSQVEETIKDGGRIIYGGKTPEGKEYEKGYFYLPTLIEDPPIDSKAMCEETFGPILPLVKFSSIEEAIDMANSSIYGLTGSVWTRDINKANRVASELEVGTVWINNHHESIPEVPFGGFKLSGIGKEFGIEGIEEFLKTKAIVFKAR